jgi:hypothetical protein
MSYKDGPSILFPLLPELCAVHQCTYVRCQQIAGTFYVYCQCIFVRIFVITITVHNIEFDRLCGLVVRVRGYRSRGPGSITGATRIFEK